MLCYCFFLNFYLFILALLGLRCCEGFPLVAGSGGYSLVVVKWASRCTGFSSRECALGHRLNSMVQWISLLRGMWNLPGSGIELVSPGLAGRFFTAEPLGKPCYFIFYM